MSFRIVLLFTAVIMVCVITDIVDAQYKFPIYYRITRRYDGQSNQMENQDKPETEPKSPFGERIDLGCSVEDCTPIVQTLETKYNNQAGEPIGENISKSLPRTRSPRPNYIYSPASWRAEGNEDQDNWSDQQAQQAIQQLLPLLRKSWRGWNEKSESENGKEDFDQ